MYVLENGVSVRLLGAEDAGAYREIRLAGLEEAPEAFSEAAEDECDRPPSHWVETVTPRGDPPEHFTLGAWNGARLTGIVTFHRDGRANARHKSMIHAMYVEPSARRGGVGAALLHETARLARKLKGLEHIHLWVLRRPGAISAARNLYARVGFVAQGPVVQRDIVVRGTYLDGEYMVLTL